MDKFRDVVNYLCATGEWQIENKSDFPGKFEGGNIPPSILPYICERLKRKDNFKLYLRVERDRLSIAASSASTKITIYAR